MNAIAKILANFYTIIRSWFAPPTNKCFHCETPHKFHLPLSNITGIIIHQGTEIGTAYNIARAPNELGIECLYASSLVFKQDSIDRVFLNGVANPNSAKDGFEIAWRDYNTNSHSPDHMIGYQATGVYLLDSDPPVYVEARSEVWLNKSSMEFERLVVKCDEA
jgi:hypothetical protein